MNKNTVEFVETARQYNGDVSLETALEMAIDLYKWALEEDNDNLAEEYYMIAEDIEESLYCLI